MRVFSAMLLNPDLYLSELFESETNDKKEMSNFCRRSGGFIGASPFTLPYLVLNLLFNNIAEKTRIVG